MLGVVSYIMEQLDRRYAFFNEMLDKNGTESLYGCFAKAGLNRSQFKSKKITFSMAEHAMLMFDRKDSLNIE